MNAPGTEGDLEPSLDDIDPELPIDRRVSRRAGWISLVAGIGLYLRTARRFADEGGGTPVPVDEPD